MQGLRSALMYQGDIQRLSGKLDEALAHFREGAGGCKYAPVRYADYFNGRLDANYTDRTGL